MKIRNLPDHIRKIAEQRYKECKSYIHYSEPVVDSFIWQNTPEGFDVWNRVNNGNFSDFHEPTKRVPTKVSELGNKEVIWCSTLVEAEEICKLLKRTDQIYLYHIYPGKICYYPITGEYCSRDFYSSRENYTIYPASQFLTSKPTETVGDLPGWRRWDNKYLEYVLSIDENSYKYTTQVEIDIREINFKDALQSANPKNLKFSDITDSDITLLKELNLWPSPDNPEKKETEFPKQWRLRYTGSIDNYPLLVKFRKEKWYFEIPPVDHCISENGSYDDPSKNSHLPRITYEQFCNHYYPGKLMYPVKKHSNLGKALKNARELGYIPITRNEPDIQYVGYQKIMSECWYPPSTSVVQVEQGLPKLYKPKKVIIFDTNIPEVKPLNIKLLKRKTT